jgi:phosphoribosyl 1,2-cyclic phosphodiesterase
MLHGMRVRFWGTRGSIATPGPSTVHYGGNTSCVEVRSSRGTLIVLDCGTGARPLGLQLVADAAGGPVGGSLLLGHTHWDHIQGLPFFGPIAEPDSVLDVYGPAQEEGPLDAVFAGVMRPPYFPITPDELHGTVRFHGAGNDDFAINGAKVRSRWVRHTSPTIGFRVDLEGHSVAYVSDHGPGCSDDPDEFVPPDVLDLADGVDVLIHDAQHTCEEFEGKRHFGHSTVDYAVHVAREAGARRLALFHHCPSHSDDNVDLMHLYASALAERVAGNLEVLAAREGLVVELQPALVR